MKREKKIIDDRRNAIFQILKENENMPILDLSKKFNVSHLTICRDLRFLKNQKKIERFYGGVKVINDNDPIADDNSISVNNESIARYASSLIEDGDIIFLNSSSTVLRMIKYIKNKKVTIITNNVKIVGMEHDNLINIVLTGGEIRYIKEVLVGEFAINNLSKVTAKKSFLGCNGISIESGMTTKNLDEVNINNLMSTRVTDGVYILANHTKIGTNSNFVSCSINNISRIITDNKSDDSEVKKFVDKGINVFVVPENDDK